MKKNLHESASIPPGMSEIFLKRQDQRGHKISMLLLSLFLTFTSINTSTKTKKVTGIMKDESGQMVMQHKQKDVTVAIYSVKACKLNTVNSYFTNI